MAFPSKNLRFINDDYGNITKFKASIKTLIIPSAKQSKGIISIGVKATSIGTLISLHLNCPHALIRQKSKGYGTNKVMEGWQAQEGSDIILVSSISNSDLKKELKKLRHLCINQIIYIED